MWVVHEGCMEEGEGTGSMTEFERDETMHHGERRAKDMLLLRQTGCAYVSSMRRLPMRAANAWAVLGLGEAEGRYALPAWRDVKNGGYRCFQGCFSCAKRCSGRAFTCEGDGG